MTTTRLTVTAILPNYNYAHYFVRRLRSVLNQTYPVSEIIVLDDGSTDGSQKLIQETIEEFRQKYPDINFITKFDKQNSGSVFSQWQKGVAIASSDYIWICELDDLASPTFLQTVMRPFQDEATVLSYTNSKIISQSKSVQFKNRLRQVKDLFRRRHKPGNYITSGLNELNDNLAIFNSIPNVSAVVFKKLPQLHEILNCAKHYHLVGDWYLYIELAKLGKIAYNHMKLNTNLRHQQSVTSQTDLLSRFKEIESIHKHVLQTTDLKPQTKTRIAALEQKLSRHWHIQ